MELRPGYKQTEVGVIPEDWEVVRVGDLASFTSGKGISVAALHAESADFPIPVFGGNGIAGFTATPLLARSSVVVGRVGQKCGEVYLTDGPAWITDNALYPKAASRRLDMHFFACALKVAGINEVKNRNDLPLVTQSILEAVRISWPSEREQRAIVVTLTDTDALIESLDQLIAKKRHLKQGAMQELLTGKTRLPGFSGDWEVKRIGDLLSISHGKSQTQVEHRNGVYPILASGGQIGLAKSYLYNQPSVLIGRKGTIDRPQYMDQPFWTVDTLFYSVIHAPNCAKYLFYQFCLIDWKQHNEASGVPSLNAKTIERIEIAVPLADEQTAIAGILSDMDTEIAALEAQLTKTRQLKQGMMAELLTGRTRLV